VTASLRVVPGEIAGRVSAPGAKSVANRALVLAALASGESRLDGVPDADDTDLLLGALERAGVEIGREGGGVVRVSPRAPVASGAEIAIDAGAGGTTARFLLPFLAARPGRWRLDGTERLRARPIGPLVEALASIGARITPAGHDARLPLAIEGGHLVSGRVEVDASVSSQFLSALMLIGATLPGGLEVGLVGELASPSYVELTLATLAAWGVGVTRTADGFVVSHRPIAGRRATLERDWSGATYLLAAGVLGGGPVAVTGLDPESVQGDRVIVDWLRGMGGSIEWREGTVVASTGRSLAAIEIDASSAPDAVPTFAVVAAFAAGRSVVRGAANLRVKESDRIAALVDGIRLLGGRAEETADGLVVDGDPSLRGATAPIAIPTRDDHRLAMAFALAGLVRGGVSIDDPGCVAKSFPAYWETLEALGARLER